MGLSPAGSIDTAWRRFHDLWDRGFRHHHDAPWRRIARLLERARRRDHPLDPSWSYVEHIVRGRRVEAVRGVGEHNELTYAIWLGADC